MEEHRKETSAAQAGGRQKGCESNRGRSMGSRADKACLHFQCRPAFSHHFLPKPTLKVQEPNTCQAVRRAGTEDNPRVCFVQLRVQHHKERCVKNTGTGERWARRRSKCPRVCFHQDNGDVAICFAGKRTKSSSDCLEMLQSSRL